MSYSIQKESLNNDEYNAEMFYINTFNDILAFKREKQNKFKKLNKVLTFGELKNMIYKEFSLMPSILMLCVNDLSEYIKVRGLKIIENERKLKGLK